MPAIATGNEPVLWLVRRIGPALFNGTGGIDAGSILAALSLHVLDPGDRPPIFERILAYCDSVRKARPTS